jgi:hypothetical protein
MLVRKFSIVFVRATRAQNLSAAFTYTQYMKFRHITAISRTQFSYVNMLNERKLRSRSQASEKSFVSVCLVCSATFIIFLF